MVDKVRKFTESALESMVKILLFFLLLTVFTEVIFRYFFNMPISWSSELSRFLFIWLSLIGSLLAVFRKAHMNIDLLIDKFGKKQQLILKLLSNILVMLFFTIIFYGGINLLKITSWQVSPALGIKMNYVYFILPFISLFALIDLCIQSYQLISENHITKNK